MKLLLSSLSLKHEQLVNLSKLAGKADPSQLKIALIENASDVYTEDQKKGWAYEDRDNFTAFGFRVDIVDLEDYRLGAKGLLERLDEADIIWVTGGNSYYLRWILRETRADTMISGLVRRGKVYGGDSAGAVIAGPTLDHYQSVDDPSSAPEVILEGLSLTNKAIVPHWDNTKYAPALKAIRGNLLNDGYEVIQLNDDQVFLVED